MSKLRHAYQSQAQVPVPTVFMAVRVRQLSQKLEMLKKEIAAHKARVTKQRELEAWSAKWSSPKQTTVGDMRKRQEVPNEGE